MDDHHNNHGHHHHHHHQHQQQYDLRQLVNGTRSTHFPSIPTAATDEFFSGHRNLTALLTTTHPQTHQNQYEMMMLGRGVVLEDFNSITTHVPPPPSTTITTATTTASASVSTPETTGYMGGDASTGRWPRQETLTLLEIRSRLDPKFKEANQKGPLWDEVSRIMSEEHGYQRSGKKCREKFENLYKYYKKTKEGKAGRHDGKHYRFFRQLEALYGENSNQTSLPETNFVNNNNFHFQQTSNSQNPHNDHSLSLTTNSTDFEIDTSSSDDGNDVKGKRKSSGRRSWKVKIKDFIDAQMKKLVEKQEEWLSKLVKTLEDKEKERALREEEWRKQEAKRVEKEQKFWSNERAWIEARDAALMEALKNLGGREMLKVEEAHDHKGVNVITGAEIQNQNEDGSEILNSTVRGSDNCTPRDDSKEGNRKRKESFYFNNNEQCSMYNQGSGYCDVNDQREEIVKLQRNDHGSSPSDSNVGNVANGDTCFPFMISEGGNLWENFGLKINKVNQNH